MSAEASPEALGSEPLDVVIVGAGIVGIACAWALQRAGRRAVVLDRKGVALATSYGNAAALAFSDIIPLAASGKLRHVPRWLMDPLGPLTIRPRYFPQVLPWLVRMWRAGLPDRVTASIAAQTALMRLAESETAASVEAAGLGAMVRKDGSLELYESEAELRAAAAGWDARQKAGIAFEHVRGECLAELQPGLSPRLVAGTFVPSWQTVDDPYDFACALADAAAALGARFVSGVDVEEVVPDGGRVRIRLGSGPRLTAEAAVIAAGAWSKRLTRPLGDRVPLDTERGYNTTLPPDAFPLRRQLIFGGHGFVVTPLSDGIRVGGAVELGGLDLPPNFARARAMLRKATDFLPGLKTDGGREWMGFRPSLPDTLPVIGPSRASGRIVYAFGHGHLGLTQSAATGRLVADLLTDRPPAIDLRPFSPQRF